MSIDNFYKRDIHFYKHMKIVDSNGDGVEDTLAILPTSNQYFLQIGINQNMDDLGIYDMVTNEEFEIIDFNGFWDENNDGSGDGYPVDPFTGLPTPPSLGDGTGDPISNYGCMNPTSPFYNPTATDGCHPDTPNCCDNDLTALPDPPVRFPNCLAFYTDWGPWNEDLILDDTEQIYHIKETCSYIIRFINKKLVDASSSELGGWYGGSVKIEVDVNDGNGFTLLSPTSNLVNNTYTNLVTLHTNNGIIYNNNTWTLSDVVKLKWKTHTISFGSYKYTSTKPYEDLVLTSIPSGSKIKLTFINGSGSNWGSNSSHIGYKLYRGYNENGQTPSPLDPPFMSPPIPNQLPYGLFNSSSDVLVMWNNYLNYLPSQTTTNWNNDSQYPLNLMYDGNTLLYNSSYPPQQSPIEVDLKCTVVENYVSFYDENGDGMVNIDTSNYPNIVNGVVDEGLFSKTRFDSPYIYIPPGTTDGTTLITDSQTLITDPILEKLIIPPPPSLGTYGGSISTPTESGWRYYGYGNIYNIKYKTTSPTCQLGGVDRTYNTWGNIVGQDPSLVNQSNSQIFLPQVDTTIGSNAATYGKNDYPVILHWNTAFDSYGGCCSKSGSVGVNNNGPWPDTICKTCHLQMTTRSAQPVLNNTVKINMQTTDSDTYYGPFYDKRNPTYNGYGLAFSKANKYCRTVKGKNGVDITTPSTGATIQRYGEVFHDGTSQAGGSVQIMGGIIHGSAIQGTPNTNFNHQNSPLGVSYNSSIWERSGESPCVDQLLPLKCKKVSGTDNGNCPSGKCMKCLYCFYCSLDDVQPGVFTGGPLEEDIPEL